MAEAAANAEPEATAPTEAAPPQAESATPTPAPNPPGPAYRTYVVQPGDILKQIAARYGVSMASIIAINTIPNADSLRVGQVLTIPPAGS
jgi:LysM repeat protein